MKDLTLERMEELTKEFNLTKEAMFTWNKKVYADGSIYVQDEKLTDEDLIVWAKNSFFVPRTNDIMVQNATEMIQEHGWDIWEEVIEEWELTEEKAEELVELINLELRRDAVRITSPSTVKGRMMSSF